MDAAVAELREIADGRADLLGEVAAGRGDEALGARKCYSPLSRLLLVGLFFQFFGIRLGVQRVEGGQARIFDRPVGEVDGV